MSWPRWCTDQQKQPEQPGSSLEAQRSLGTAQRRQEKHRITQEKPQSECAGEPGSEQKCSTSLPGGNLVDGLPPALNTAVAQVRGRSVALIAPHKTTSELCKYHCGTGPRHVRAFCCPTPGQPLISSNTTVAQVRGRSVALTAPHQTTSELCQYDCGTGPRQVRGTCCPTQDSH